MATAKSDNSRAADVIKNWLRNRNTLEFLGTKVKKGLFTVEDWKVRWEDGGKVLLNETTVECVSLLQRMSNTRERTITLDVEMEDYHRIKNEGR